MICSVGNLFNRVIVQLRSVHLFFVQLLIYSIDFCSVSFLFKSFVQLSLFKTTSIIWQGRTQSKWGKRRTNAVRGNRQQFRGQRRVDLMQFDLKTFMHSCCTICSISGLSGPRFNRRLDDPLKHPSKCPSRERPCTNFFPSTHDGKSKRSFWIEKCLRGNFRSKRDSFLQY